MAEDKNGRSKAIEMALGQIEKQFGKGSIMKLGDRDITGIPYIPVSVRSRHQSGRRSCARRSVGVESSRKPSRRPS